MTSIVRRNVYRAPKEYRAHAHRTGNDFCECTIGDRRYVVRRATVSMAPSPPAVWHGCYRVEYRRHSWHEVRVNKDFERALLAAALPAFAAYDASLEQAEA
jgi:hypothetical protein